MPWSRRPTVVHTMHQHSAHSPVKITIVLSGWEGAMSHLQLVGWLLHQRRLLKSDTFKLSFFGSKLLADTFQPFFITLHFVGNIDFVFRSTLKMMNPMSAMSKTDKQSRSYLQMNLLCVRKKCCLFKCVTKHCGHQKSFQDKTQISRIQPRSCTLSSEAHIHFPIIESSQSGIYQPRHVSLSLEMTSSALYISESVKIHSDHYRGSSEALLM